MYALIRKSIAWKDFSIKSNILDFYKTSFPKFWSYLHVNSEWGEIASCKTSGLLWSKLVACLFLCLIVIPDWFAYFSGKVSVPKFSNLFLSFSNKTTLIIIQDISLNLRHSTCTWNKINNWNGFSLSMESFKSYITFYYLYVKVCCIKIRPAHPTKIQEYIFSLFFVQFVVTIESVLS